MSRAALTAPPRPEPTRARIVVVQTAPEAGDPDGNLEQVVSLVRRAADEHRPDLVVLPDRLRGRAGEPGLTERADGETWAALRLMAADAGCLVAGGSVAATGSGVRARYVIAEPGGATHVHDKDRPDPWEARDVGLGDGDNFALTPLGATGIACGAEWARVITAQRLRARVSCVIGGCGISSSDAHPRTTGRAHAHHAAIVRELAPRMARVVGAPAAIAVQAEGPEADEAVGGLRGPRLLGRSQIVDRDGRVLAAVEGPGPGYACATVDLGRTGEAPLDPVPEGPWLPLLPVSTRLVARVATAVNGRRYVRRLRRYELPWQDDPIPAQLPYNPPTTGGAPRA